MREFKFRVYDKVSEYMKYLGKDTHDTMWFDEFNRGSYSNLQCGDGGASTPEEDSDEYGYSPLMQYTGLKDKNGREIYEGDVVCDRWANCYTPIFRNGIYMAYNPKDLYLTKHEPSTQFNVIWKDGCEVIGNIYENPELIEVSND